MLRSVISRKKGFTLLEVMIAMAILAIALVGVFQLQSQSLSMAGDARFLTVSSLLAQGKMAEIEKMYPKGISDSDGSFGEDYPDYLWRVEVRDTAFQYLKKIDVIVTNNKLGSKYVYQLELYRFIRK